MKTFYDFKLKILLLSIRILKPKSRCSFYKTCMHPDDQGRIHYRKENEVCTNYYEPDRTYCGLWRTLKRRKYEEKHKQ